MDCPQCNDMLKKTFTHIEGIDIKLASFQCRQCNYCDIDAASADKILREILA
ncbi:MAG TPA: hypothetical protein VJJ75_03305 [Candidatus Nanoarchaeia archaeon]|nr:hypothetical protein [Candidatus Nanoarchaeia archaeon]